MILSKSKNLYVIVVTYNAMKWIEDCLNSTKGFKVIVVDNNSDDGTVPYIQKHFSEIEILQQDQNLGFGKANNLGISRAINLAADYVFLLNQDAYLYEETLETLMSTHQSYPEYGILSPIHLNGKGDLLDQDFHYYVSYEFNKDFISDFVLRKKNTPVYDVPFINAAGWLLTKKCLETVGGFDPMFYHYGEDDNYCQRVKFHGLKIGIVSKAFLKHDREERFEQVECLRDDSFLRLERQWKIHFGDINKINIIHDLDKLLSHRKKRWLRTYFTNSKMSRKYKQELLLLKKIIPQIKKSRDKNMLPGNHYLYSLESAK